MALQLPLIESNSMKAAISFNWMVTPLIDILEVDGALSEYLQVLAGVI